MKIRILHVLYKFDTGGLENGLINLVNWLPEDHFSHVICILAEGKRCAAKIKKSNVVYYELKKKDGNDVSIPFRIASIVRNEGINLVHTRNWVSLVEGVVGALMGGCTRIVHSEHGKEIDDLGSSSRRAIAKKFCYKLVSNLITVSNGLREEIVANRECVDHKVTAIINGVDCERFIPGTKSSVEEIKARYGIPANGKMVIGAIGRLAPIKNYESMIDICRQLNSDDYIFVLVGDGPERKVLEAKASELNVQHQFIFTGEIRDVAPVLTCFDVFLNTSHFEGVSNTILEAMASGVPIIANEVGGNVELIREGVNGYLIENGSVDRFCEKIVFLRENQAVLFEMAANARAIAEQQFSLSNMIGNYHRIYLETIEGT